MHMMISALEKNKAEKENNKCGGCGGVLRVVGHIWLGYQRRPQREDIDMWGDWSCRRKESGENTLQAEQTAEDKVRGVLGQASCPRGTKGKRLISLHLKRVARDNGREVAGESRPCRIYMWGFGCLLWVRWQISHWRVLENGKDIIWLFNRISAIK